MGKAAIIIYGLIIANLTGILYIWIAGSGTMLITGGASTLIALGRLTGLLGEYLILLQLILIGRISVIEQLYGFDRLNTVHRTVGYSMVTFFVLHPLFLTIGYASLSGVSLWSQFVDFLAHWEDVFDALIGLALFLLVIAVSIAIVRRAMRYETWYFTHLLMYAGIAFVFGHQTNAGDVSVGAALWYWYVLNFVVFGLVLVYRFLKPFYLFYRHRFEVTAIREESPNIISIFLTGRDIETFKYKAGQYANFNFLRYGLWYSHPFSFSSAPGSSTLRVSAKNAGDFTSQLKRITPGTKVILDGPLGVFTEAKAVKGKYLLIAGGIGITPLRALAESITRKGYQDTVLLYGAQKEQDLVFQDELRRYPMTQHYFLSNETKAGYETGNISVEKVVMRVPDWKDRDIYICGPFGMITTLASSLKALGASSDQLHFERFAY